MTRTVLAFTAAILLAGVSSPGLVQTARADEGAAVYKTLAEKVGPAMVTVKCIMKFEGGGMGGGDEGREMELTGLMVEATGVVLCSNYKLGGFASMMGGGASANPTDLKVFAGEEAIGSGGEGYKAKILARDTDLDLCWVQIDDAKASGKAFAIVDLANRSAPGVGDRLLTVSRRGKFFDHALVIEEGRVGGTASKPRKVMLPSGNAFSDLGMPVFTEDGKIAGIGVLQVPRKEDMEGGDGGDMFERMGGGGPVILPAEEVAKATARSKEAAGSSTEAPKEEPKKEEPKK